MRFLILIAYLSIFILGCNSSHDKEIVNNEKFSKETLDALICDFHSKFEETCFNNIVEDTFYRLWFKPNIDSQFVIKIRKINNDYFIITKSLNPYALSFLPNENISSINYSYVLSKLDAYTLDSLHSKMQKSDFWNLEKIKATEGLYGGVSIAIEAIEGNNRQKIGRDEFTLSNDLRNIVYYFLDLGKKERYKTLLLKEKEIKELYHNK